MKDNNLYSKYTLELLLDKIGVIKRHQYSPDKINYSEITKKQEDIFKIFGFNKPLSN
jgi:hypothetical protein